MLTVSVLFFVACGDTSRPDSGPNIADALPVSAPHPGQALHQTYCGTCHILPDPSDLDRATWQNAILIRMGAYMGIYNDNQQYFDSLPAKWLEPGPGGKRVLAAGIYPAKPMLSRPEFEQIKDYILQNAPQKTIGAMNALPIVHEMPGFKARIMRPDTNLNPLVTAIAIDAEQQQIYAGFLQQGIVQVDPLGKLSNYFAHFYGPVQIRVEPNRLSIADIGSIKGSDHPQGQFVAVASMQALKKRKTSLKMNGLQRPVFSAWADLDGDGDEDLVLCEFGYHLGELAWHENVGKGPWKRHTLYPDDGTVAVSLHDFDGNGQVDILALMANANEGVRLFLNLGKGKFEQKELFRYNPTFGAAALEVVDFDQDGDMDFLVSNGDNGDYKPILKANHGIRLYRNQGNLEFEEAFFLPLNGAYGTRTHDYDQDGDMDIAAVSFYPDYGRGGEEAFVYFEQTKANEFTARTFPEAGLSRWMVLDAGDLDGDGDLDLALGAFNVKSSDASEETYQHWMKGNVPILILENLLNEGK